MTGPRPHTPEQTRFAVITIQKLKAGEPINPKSCTRAYLGNYHLVVKDMLTAYQEATAGAEDEASLLASMEAYWLGVRQDKQYRELIDAVDQHDLKDMGAHVFDAPMTPEYRPILTVMSDVHAKAIDWLWWPYIAIGKICMVDGDPGIGKSLLTLQLAARLSVGDPLPDQQGKPTITYDGPVNTLILCKEDGLEDTIKPRLEAAGANCDHIIHMGNYLDKDGGEHYFDLQHLCALEEALRLHRPTLVILDPIQSYFGQININQSNETRPLLDRLTALAEKYRCAIVLIRHPSKPGQSIGKVIHRGLGSVDLIGAARTGLFVEQHPMDPGKVLLGQSKSNIGPMGRTQVFTKYEGQFLWCGVSRLSAEIIGGSGRGPDPYAFLEAVCWLEGRMEPEIPQKSTDIDKAAVDEGLSTRVLGRAKKALGIRSTQLSDGWIWTLPALTAIERPAQPSTRSSAEKTRSTDDTAATGNTGVTDVSDLKSTAYERNMAERSDPSVASVASDPSVDLVPLQGDRDPLPLPMIDPMVLDERYSWKPDLNNLNNLNNLNGISKEAASTLSIVADPPRQAVRCVCGYELADIHKVCPSCRRLRPEGM